MKRGYSYSIRRDIKSIERKLGLLRRKIWNPLFHFKYPKIAIFVLLAFIAYIIFANPDTQGFISSLGKLEYFGIIIAGMLFTFGFTTPFAVGFFVILNPENPVLTALMGGVGSLLGDILIFSFIRFSFIEEFNRLKRTPIIKGIRNEMKMRFSQKARMYLLYVLAGIVISSPLPDEAGVMMLAGLTNIKLRNLVPISFLFNSLGILIMCLL
jgi:hypothetical protein